MLTRVYRLFRRITTIDALQFGFVNDPPITVKAHVIGKCLTDIAERYPARWTAESVTTAMPVPDNSK